MNLFDYSSSEDSEAEDRKPILKKAKTAVFYVPKKQEEEAFTSKLQVAKTSFLDSLPTPSTTQIQQKSKSLNVPFISRKDKVEVVENGAEKVTEQRVTVVDEEEEEEEEFDFFSLGKSSGKREQTAPKLGPFKPDHAKNASLEQADEKRSPFVFKPIQKPLLQIPPTSNSHAISANDSRLMSNSQTIIQTVSHSDLLGDSQDRARKRQLLEAARESRNLIEDPFEKLEGSYIATSASTRTNSIMQMAYNAKELYFDRVERKAEQKAVKRIVRQKYGF